MRLFLLLASLSLVVAPVSAQAGVALLMAPDFDPCVPPNVFEATARASSIVVYEVRAGRGNIAARDIQVAATLKGAPPPHFPGGGPAIYRGARLLVFADADHALPACSTIDLGVHAMTAIGGDEASMLEAIRRFIESEGEARRALLVEWATSGATLIAAEAADALAADPALAAALTPAEITRLVRALGTPVAPDEADRSLARIPALARVLARRHVVDAVPAIGAWMGRARVSPVFLEGALELLTNHHDDAFVPGREIAPTEVPSMRQRWQRFYEAHRADSPATLVAAGFAERGLRAGAPPGRADLARVVRSAPDVLTRIVAIERCERVRRVALDPGIRTYLHTADYAPFWERAAAACEAPLAGGPTPHRSP